MEKAYAKVNIYLHVVGKRDDGYHNIESLMVPIDLYDELEFKASRNICVESNINIDDNIIYKAAKLLKDRYQVKKGVKIILHKRIPIGAGLAGGSADASATLRGLNKYWNLNLDMETLTKLSLEIGSDTAFCMYNKPAIVTGRGENLQFVEYNGPKKMLLLNPNFQVNTKDVFMEYKPEDSEDGNNHLEKATLRLYPELNELKREFSSLGYNLTMSGSGPSFFAFIEENPELLFPLVMPFFYKKMICHIL